MKPERSQGIELIPDSWTVHPPFITQKLEFSSFPQAMRFGTFVHEAAQKWDAEVEVSAHGKVLMIKVSPTNGNELTEAAYELARGIDNTYQLFRPKLTPKNR